MFTLDTLYILLCCYKNNTLPYAEYVAYKELFQGYSFLRERGFDLEDPDVRQTLYEMRFNPEEKLAAECAYMETYFNSRAQEDFLAGKTNLASAIWTTLGRMERMQLDTKPHVWDDLLDEEDEPIEWLIHGLLPKHGTSIMSAIAKTGKSSLIRFMVKCLTTATPFLEMSVPKPVRVHYFCLEDYKTLFKKSMRKLYNGEKNPYLTVQFGINISSFVRDLRLAAERSDVVIIDTLFRVLDLEDPNNYAIVTPALATITNTAKRYGCHILSAHHNNKASASGGSSLGRVCKLKTACYTRPYEPQRTN